MINEKLNSLYKYHYGNKINNIIPCGIVDEETYMSVYPKIVFVLREAHMRTPYKIDTGWTLPKGLKRQVEKGISNTPLAKHYMYTWRQAGVWAYAIIYGFERYETLKKTPYVTKGLQAIGMTNLKKTGGEASSNLREISYYAKKEKNLWQKELEIMNPDLVICGSTYQDVRDSLDLDEMPLAEIDGMPYSYSIMNSDHGQHVIIDFWHPNNRRNRNKNLTVLKLLVDRLKEKGLLRG